MQGMSLAGSSPSRKRIEHDFYATPKHATEAILNEIKLQGSILEPAAGEGHISAVLRQYYPRSEIISTDLVQRKERFGIHICGGIDFLTYDFERKYDNVITNPPFSLASEFVDKALEVANDKVLIFVKIQFLEGMKRKQLFEHTPLRYIYVFRRRVSPLPNGNSFDEKGKPWSSTMCFAWFVFENGYTGEPVVRWL